MTQELDLSDIQGNIIRAYGHFKFTVARYYFLHINKDKSDGARKFVDAVRKLVTTSERWGKEKNRVPRPNVTLNIGFSYYGLKALGLPTRSLAALPSEFHDGMKLRAHILGDEGESDPKHWDKIWKDSNRDSETQVHIWISMNAFFGFESEFDNQFALLQEAIDTSKGGVTLLTGHGPNGDGEFQEAHVLRDRKPGSDPNSVPELLSCEHFGFNDGISNPVFEGQFGPKTEKVRMIGRGKLMPDQTWAPNATGEFLLGHVDESQELPPAARPHDFTRNGTFMVYRKLHQNVKSFKDYVAGQAKTYAKIMSDSKTKIDKDEADVTIRAKMVGRWPNGVPLVVAPTYEDLNQFNEKWKDIEDIALKKLKREDLTEGEKTRQAEYNRILVDFKYNDDIEGFKCPVSAHIRRANTRDMLDPLINTKDAKGSALNMRRRILRRGLPYGEYNPDNPSDGDEQGIIFMAICASLFRQFEFVQQQWIQYGLDFNVGNDTCPVIGKHDKGDKFVIASDPETGKPPYICADPPPFVTTRGGEYFFIPSLTALRMIAMGVVDTT